VRATRALRGRNDLTDGMSVPRSIKRVSATACAVGVSLMLASCGGYFADHWPRWAGGMPDDVPPRPGAPGYDEFISHGQPLAKPVNAAQPNPASPGVAVTGPQTAATAAGPAAVAAPAEPVAPAAPASDQPAEDSSVVKGGLY
jgi:hypothetical protein